MDSVHACVGFGTLPWGNRTPQGFPKPALDPFTFSRGPAGQYPVGLAPFPGGFLNPPAEYGNFPGISGLPTQWPVSFIQALGFIWSILLGNTGANKVTGPFFPPGVSSEAPPWQPQPSWTPQRPALPKNLQSFLNGEVTRTIPPLSRKSLEQLNKTQDPDIQEALEAINQDRQGRLQLDQMVQKHYTIRRGNLSNEILGSTDPEKKEIVINKRINNEGQFLATIGHELFHVIPDGARGPEDSQKEELLANIGGEAMAARILKLNPLTVVSPERLDELQAQVIALYPELPAYNEIQQSVRDIGISI